MKSPWQYFSLDELKCKCAKCGSTGLEMDEEFMRQIIMLREELGFPFSVSSAYRCPAHNAKVSNTGENGPHTTGKAMDIITRGEQAYLLAKKAFIQGLSGIGFSQKGITRFIHLDILEAPEYPRPTIWSYE